MTWEMFAAHPSDARQGRFVTVGPRRFVELHGYTDTDIVPVTVTEAPDGPYYGWMGAEYDHHKADTEPCMIQPHAGMFSMQFPYGPEAEVEAGKGRIVRLTISWR